LAILVLCVYSAALGKVQFDLPYVAVSRSLVQ